MCFIDKSDSIMIVNALKLFLNRRERERYPVEMGAFQKDMLYSEWKSRKSAERWVVIRK